MSETIKRMMKYEKSSAIKALNPGFFGIAPDSAIEPSKPASNDPGAIAPHFLRPSTDEQKLNKTEYDKNTCQGVSHTIQKESPLPRKKRKNNDRSKGKGTDEQAGGRFKVSITFNFADKRRRDLDGGAATILDSLITVRRQLENSVRNPLIMSISGKY